MLKIINIILAKKGREKQYDIFLYYLNKISRGRDIHLYTTSCGDSLDYKSEYFQHLNNIKVTHNFLNLKIFNKPKLLNYSLQAMRKGDLICVFDIDMIYPSCFFEKVSALFSTGNNYIVSYGQRLTESQTSDVYKNLDMAEGLLPVEGEEFKGCSQIAFNLEVYNIFKSYFSGFYDEAYNGWGGEDSDLSYKSRILDKKGIIKKETIRDVWAHLWHPDSKPKDYKKGHNYNYFHTSKERIEKIINEYVS